MKKKYIFLALLVVGLFLSSTTLVLAENIAKIDSVGKAYYNHPYFGNDVLKLELHMDNDGNGNDQQDELEVCQWWEVWEWFDEDGICSEEAYDYILDPETDEIIGAWSMFKLQRKTGNHWKTIKILDHSFEDCSEDGYVCIKRVMRMNENTYMNVTYKLNDGETKIKFDIDIQSGTNNKEYRLKYRLHSLPNITEAGERKVNFDEFFYDWNDITEYQTTHVISDNGNTFEQITELGKLTKGETIYIDPLITTDTGIANFVWTNLVTDSNDDNWWVQKEGTDIKIHTDASGSWAVNYTGADGSALRGYSSAIDSNDVIHIVGRLGEYYNYSTSTGVYTGDSGYTWNGANYDFIDVDQDDNIFIKDKDGADDPHIWWRNTTGWADADFTTSNDDYNSPIGRIRASDNIVFGQYALAGSPNTLRTHMFFKNNWTVGAEDNFVFGSLDQSDLLTVDYNADQFLTCGWDGTNDILECNVYNGTAWGTSVEWDVTGKSGIQDALRVYLAQATSGTYAMFVDDGGGIYLTSFNETDWDGLNFDLDIDNNYELNLEATPVDAVDGTHVSLYEGSDKFGFAYQSGGDWYFDEAPSGLVVHAYDEETGNILDNWNIYVFNGTTSDTQTGIDSYNEKWVGSAIQVQLSKTGYAVRNNYVSISNYGDYYPLDAYLLNASNGNYVVFGIINAWGVPVPNTTVIAERYINGAWTVVEQTLSDSAGSATMFLDPAATYTVSFNKTGCTYLQNVINPTSSLYTVQLSCAAVGNLTNYTSPSTNFTWDWYPKTAGLCNRTNQSFWYSVSDSENLTTEYGVNFTVNNTLLWNVRGTNAAGANMSTTLDLSTYYNYPAVMIINYTRTPYNVVYRTFHYNVYDWNCLNEGYYNTSIWNIYNKVQAGTYDIGATGLLIIALFISLAGAGASSAIFGVGAGGSSFIFLGVFILFVWLFGVTTWPIVFLMVIIALSIGIVKVAI